MIQSKLIREPVNILAGLKLPSEVESIIERFNSKSFEAYVVGGCVRDCIMGITPKDWDITTNAKPNEIKALFNKTIDTGIKHGTVTVIINKQPFEVTTYRIDGEYKDKRRPDNVEFTEDLIMDLSRRDFTMNAIAYHKFYIDPFDGICDIKNGVIRCVGNPNLRFQEDALRMLRALRFSTQLNFCIEPSTFVAIKQNSELISCISIERVRDELLKLIAADTLDNFKLLTESNILHHVNPKLNAHIKSDVQKYLTKSPKDIVLLMTILLHGLSFDAADILYQFKFDNRTIRNVLSLTKFLNSKLDDLYDMRKIVANLGYDLTYKLIILRRIFKIDNDILNLESNFEKIKGDCVNIKDLAVNGDDLKNFGLSGKQIGVALNHLLDVVLNDQSQNVKHLLIKHLGGEL